VIEVRVNGESVRLPDRATVADAVEAAGAEPGARGVAVAVEDEVVPRSQLGSRELSGGERIEVVVAIQGGA
jgi:sulfur carrier protein